MGISGGHGTGWRALRGPGRGCLPTGNSCSPRLDNGSGVSREVHAPFCESLGVGSPRATHPVALCRSREEAESALARLRAWVSANGLTLHPDKTHVGDCRVEGQGFEFLGYRFEAGQRWVRKKSLMSLRDNIRAKTKRNEGNSIAYVIAALNPTLRGWYGYFQHAHRFTFPSIDGFVRRRLRAMLRRQKHRPGQGRCQRDHQQWPNAFFADLGLFTMSEAHRLARQSRCGNN